MFYTAPAAFIQDQTLAMVERNPAFIEAARFSTWRGKHYFLFGRRDRVNQVARACTGSLRLSLYWRADFDAMPDAFRWTRREFAVDFPAPRGLYAERRAHGFVPQPNFDKLEPMTLEGDIPREARAALLSSSPISTTFTYRYAIKQQLVSTVMVRFSLNKALPPDAGSHDDLAILFRSAELNPIPRL